MSRHEARPEASRQLIYAENYCGVNRQLIIHTTLAAAITIGSFILAFLPHLGAFIAPAVIGLFWTLVVGANLLFIAWPTGIGIDSGGISIGGIRGRERRIKRGAWPPRKPYRTIYQSRAVFSCPWEGVRGLYLITGRQEYKALSRTLTRSRKVYRKRNHGNSFALLGFLPSPHMQAYLVITNHTARTSSDPPKFRPYRVPQTFTYIVGIPSAVWLVPTRRPEALRAALAQVPGAPPVQDHLPPGGEEFHFEAPTPA